VTLTDENAVFAETRRDFLQMNVLAGNSAHGISVVSRALGEVYQVFESGGGGGDEGSSER
jgi:hypothetical protein